MLLFLIIYITYCQCRAKKLNLALEESRRTQNNSAMLIASPNLSYPINIQPQQPYSHVNPTNPYGQPVPFGKE